MIRVILGNPHIHPHNQASDLSLDDGPNVTLNPKNTGAYFSYTLRQLEGPV